MLVRARGSAHAKLAHGWGIGHDREILIRGQQMLRVDARWERRREMDNLSYYSND